MNRPRKISIYIWGLRTFAVALIGYFALANWPAAAQQGPGNGFTGNDIPLTGGLTKTAAGNHADDSTADSAVTRRSLFFIVREGAGPLIIPLLLCSFVLLVFTFERVICLRSGRVIPGPFVKRFLHQLKEGQLDREQATLICEENGSPIARIFGSAVKKWGKSSVEIEQAIIDSGEREAHELRRYMRVFNGVATVSPMFGLLGTVAGMIQAFSDIGSSHAMGKPEMLAKGISEALVMTGAGLAVAIPALVLYWMFAGMVDRLIMRIDALGQKVVGAISAEALQDAAKSRSSKRAA